MNNRALLILPAIAATTVALSGCSVVDMFSDQTEDRFADYAEFSDAADLTFRTADWVPTDSTTLAVRYFNQKPGNMMTFTSETGVAADTCTVGELTGHPLLEAGWWPSGEPADGMICGSDWQVFENDGIWYAWTN